MIGQAFADEIFRVFKNKYPNIKIELINTNDAVKFMIERVKGNDVQKILFQLKNIIILNNKQLIDHFFSLTKKNKSAINKKELKKYLCVEFGEKLNQKTKKSLK